MEFNEKLLAYATEGIKPIQYICLEVLALLILHNYDLEEADCILKNIVTELAEADSSFMNTLYIDFFEI